MALSLLEPWMLTNPFHKVIDNDNNAQEVVYEHLLHNNKKSKNYNIKIRDIDDHLHTETVQDPGLLVHVV